MHSLNYRFIIPWIMACSKINCHVLQIYVFPIIPKHTRLHSDYLLSCSLGFFPSLSCGSSAQANKCTGYMSFQEATQKCIIAYSNCPGFDWLCVWKGVSDTVLEIRSVGNCACLNIETPFYTVFNGGGQGVRIMYKYLRLLNRIFLHSPHYSLCKHSGKNVLFRLMFT